LVTHASANAIYICNSSAVIYSSAKLTFDFANLLTFLASQTCRRCSSFSGRV
jgi:hypothetical protein